jgi:phage baseplate assembly protein V
MIVKYGIISDASRPGYAKVYFEEDDISTDWWPVVRTFSLKDKVSYALNVNEHVACLAAFNLEEGVILGAIHNDVDTPDPGAGPGKFRKVFEDGTVLEYDKIAHKFTGTIAGTAQITAEAVTIIGNVTITGNLAFSGTLSGGEGSALSFDGSTLKAPDVEAAGTVSLKTHVHTDVTVGSGLTGPPE